MKISIPLCPACNQPAEALYESLYAWASLNPVSPTGETDYGGESEVLWDSQRPVDESTNPELQRVICCNDHTWLTAIDW